VSKLTRPRWLLPALVLLILSVDACASRPSPAVVALPNGYYLQASKGDELSRVKSNGRAVVPGPIAAYAVSRNIVMGALGAPPPLARTYTNDLPFKGDANTRYFILDTLTGKLVTGLDEAAWKMQLTSLGVQGPIEVHTPFFPE
jgi:hypothetical protein